MKLFNANKIILVKYARIFLRCKLSMNKPTTRNKAAEIVLAFNDALNASDLDGMMALMTRDCIFENTYPAPDGTIYEGQEAVRSFWEAFFKGSASARFTPEEIFVAENRCVMRWIYRWSNPKGEQGHIRGVDIYTIRDGLIAEKLSYVKG